MSRFVSVGTVEEPPERDEEWLKAQHAIDAAKTQKEEASRQDSGKTLYETLQANKAAKQEAFEESIRLKNQFRSLDEDEVEFLDSILESTRAKDEAVKRETLEQLEAFKKQQEDAAKLANIEEATEKPVEEVVEKWTVAGRKRKKTKDTDTLPGFKLRRLSSTSESPRHLERSTSIPIIEASPTTKVPKEHPLGVTPPASEKDGSGVALVSSKVKSSAPAATTASSRKTSNAVSGLGLDAYSSDEE
ncbi:hypothetical protein LTR28_005858 [Elasticomyces elasticus]|nr:hypothetical protein LTR28_005858 [Elasticomyces elasticus]